MGEWARQDPAAAANYIGELSVSERTLQSAERVAQRWGASDPRGAIDWALGQEDPALRERALRGAVAAWAEQDLSSAADFAASLEEDSELRSAVRAVAQRWAELDPGEALGWLGGLPEGARGDAGREILNHLAHEDPRAAAEYYAGMVSAGADGWVMSEPGLLVDAAADIAGRWSELDPGQAAQWAVELPEGDAQSRAVGSVADRWVWADPAAASEWIASLPPGEMRDVAAERLVNQIAATNPEAAFEWALSVEAEGRRMHLARRVLDRWTVSDPGAAQSALDASNLTPEQRASVEPQ
jgi:hypothetical protein